MSSAEKFVDDFEDIMVSYMNGTIVLHLVLKPLGVESDNEVTTKH